MIQAPLTPKKPPLPTWFWATLAILIAAMLTSLLASVMLPRPTAPHPSKNVQLAQPPVSDISPTASRPAITPVPPASPTVTEFPMPAPVTAGASTPLPPASATLPPLIQHWVTNSHAGAYTHIRGPKLAIVLDDMGVAPDETRQALNLPAAVTFSFLSFGSVTPQLSQQAFEKGHDIMMHLPMEPLPHPHKMNPGPDTLEVGDAADVLIAKLEHHLQQLGEISVGVNNHMGSRFTGWAEGMRTVLAQLDTDGYMFLDSLTITPTATSGAARGLNLPVMKRDVFLDHDPSPEAIGREFDRAVALAKKQGFAIAIGHPLSTTLAVLEERLPTLQGVTLVPISAGLPANLAKSK